MALRNPLLFFKLSYRAEFLSYKNVRTALKPQRCLLSNRTCKYAQGTFYPHISFCSFSMSKSKTAELIDRNKILNFKVRQNNSELRTFVQGNLRDGARTLKNTIARFFLTQPVFLLWNRINRIETGA